MRYFKVQIGFDEGNYISINEHELPLAIKAMGTGEVAVFDEGMVAGNNIISVTPDYNRAMGYNKGYKLTGEDYRHIGKATMHEHLDLLADIKAIGSDPNLLE